ncbi:DUF4113 domain-containing protein, partial [Klebsiella sp. GG_Kp173]
TQPATGETYPKSDLFNKAEGRSYANSDALMNVLDTINNSGKGKVWFAGRGIAPAWSMKRDMLSPAYTTRWDSIPIATL